MAPDSVPATPRLSALRARRVGDRIRVTVDAVDIKDGNVPIFVSGEDTRGWNGEPLVTRTVHAFPGKRRYRVTLPARAGLRFVVARLDLAEGARLTAPVRQGRVPQ